MTRRPNAEAARLVVDGNLALASARYADAESLYLRAIRVDEKDFSPWYNLGLLHKHQQRWGNSFDFFVRTVERLPAQITAELYAAVVWNYGITATITKNWPEAHGAWQRLGYAVQGKPSSPPRVITGPLLFRIDGGTDEVEMLDPVRGRQSSTGRVFVRDASRTDTVDGRAVFPVLFEEGEACT